MVDKEKYLAQAYKARYDSLDFRCRQLFKDVGGLKGKVLLEIGGGEGLFSIWALSKGVKSVVLLEPELDGCRPGVKERLKSNIKNLDVRNLEFKTLRFQDYVTAKRFDLILSYNNINHLDEEACRNILKSRHAIKKYMDIFGKAYHLLNYGGHFVISDAARINYWHKYLGRQSPVVRSINWKVHQEPTTWSTIAQAMGFDQTSIRWQKYYTLRHFGRLFSNKFFARLTNSQFILTLQKRDA